MHAELQGLIFMSVEKMILRMWMIKFCLLTFSHNFNLVLSWWNTPFIFEGQANICTDRHILFFDKSTDLCKLTTYSGRQKHLVQANLWTMDILQPTKNKQTEMQQQMEIFMVMKVSTLGYLQDVKVVSIQTQEVSFKSKNMFACSQSRKPLW